MTKEIIRPHSLKEFIDCDDALFHYTKRSTALEMILSGNFFKLFKLLNTNDPREYKNRLLSVSGWNWTKETEKLIKESHRYSDVLLRKNSFFSSFSENKYSDKELLSRGYIKPRMWSQYGEDHYGVCLVLSKKRLINTIRDYIDHGSYFLFSDSVKYGVSNNRSGSGILSVDGDSFENKPPFQIALEHVKKYSSELFFQKDNDYRDEDEYRVVVCGSSENSSEMQSIDIKATDCVKGIILGERFPKVYRPTIEALCEEINIEYKKLHWEKDRYSLLNRL